MSRLFRRMRLRGYQFDLDEANTHLYQHQTECAICRKANKPIQMCADGEWLEAKAVIAAKELQRAKETK